MHASEKIRMQFGTQNAQLPSLLAIQNHQNWNQELLKKQLSSGQSLQESPCSSRPIDEYNEGIGEQGIEKYSFPAREKKNPLLSSKGSIQSRAFEDSFDDQINNGQSLPTSGPRLSTVINQNVGHSAQGIGEASNKDQPSDLMHDSHTKNTSFQQ